MQTYSLIPFSTSAPSITITVQVSKVTVDAANCIQLIYTLQDPQHIVAHGLTQQPMMQAIEGATAVNHTTTNQAIKSDTLLNYATETHRQDFLWQHTCFEAFIQPVGSDAYFELNLAATSAGAWNTYAFDSYRNPKQMPPRRATQPLLKQFTIQPNGVTAVLDLSCLPLALNTRFKLGLCAVIKQQSHNDETENNISYWSLAHNKTQADFHDANYWLVEL